MTSREPSQYFSEQPSGTEVRRTITAHVWGRELTLITGSGVFAAAGLDRGTAVLLRASPNTGRSSANPRPRLRVRPHRAGFGRALSWCARGCGRCERAGACALPGQCGGARCGGPGTSAAAGRGRSGEALRRDLVQSSSPNRQAGVAWATAQLAAATRTRRCGTHGDREEPWRGHPAAVAARAGLSLRARRLSQRLSSASGPQSALKTSLETKPSAPECAQQE